MFLNLRATIAPRKFTGTQFSSSKKIHDIHDIISDPERPEAQRGEGGTSCKSAVRVGLSSRSDRTRTNLLIATCRNFIVL